MPPEGPWELQGVELLSQKELYCQILLLLHLLPQDLLLLQVRPPRLPQPCGSRSGQACLSSHWCLSPLSPASLATATVRRCWTVSSSVGSSWLRR